MNRSVGRNDPCPCGSGKKFKKCCEKRLGSGKKIEASVLSTGLSGGKTLEGKASKISADFFSRPKVPVQKELSDLKKKESKHPPEADKPM